MGASLRACDAPLRTLVLEFPPELPTQDADAVLGVLAGQLPLGAVSSLKLLNLKEEAGAALAQLRGLLPPGAQLSRG